MTCGIRAAQLAKAMPVEMNAAYVARTAAGTSPRGASLRDAQGDGTVMEAGSLAVAGAGRPALGAPVSLYPELALRLWDAQEPLAPFPA